MCGLEYRNSVTVPTSSIGCSWSNIANEWCPHVGPLIASHAPAAKSAAVCCLTRTPDLPCVKLQLKCEFQREFRMSTKRLSPSGLLGQMSCSHLRSATTIAIRFPCRNKRDKL